ncbi:MAG: serine/threonine protein kinase [Myxococcales bacterium]|nr:serine/threonine protein kinase [Myxococcales bacterium]
MGIGARIGDYVIEGEVEISPGDPNHEGALGLYEAVHRVLPRKVMLKVLQPHLVGVRPVAVQMLREACILEALHHAGIPRVYECGVTTDRRPWVAIELVSGASFDLEVRQRSVVIKDVVTLIENVADILAHAHSRGVVHRNLRPQTIVRDHDDRRGFPLCITEWGDARTLDTSAPMESSEEVHYYRAPELLAGDPFDGRVDVFSLGVIAYEALTGQLPSLPIARRCPMAPAKLTRLIDRMLAVDPLTRPTAFEVADDVRDIGSTATIDFSIEPEGDSVVQPAEEIVLLTDLSREALPEPIRERPRWTPPWALKDRTAAVPEGGAPRTRRTRSVRDDT